MALAAIHSMNYIFSIKKFLLKAVLLICIAINHYCQVLINFVDQNMAESLTSLSLSLTVVSVGGMSGGRGQHCYVPGCGSARYGKFGTKNI